MNKDKESPEKRINKDEFSNLVWKTKEGFFVSCGNNSSIFLKLKDFMELKYISQRTKIIYSLFMKKEDKKYLERFFNKYRS